MEEKQQKVVDTITKLLEESGMEMRIQQTIVISSKEVKEIPSPYTGEIPPEATPA